MTSPGFRPLHIACLLLALAPRAWADDAAALDDREILNPRMLMQAPPPNGAPPGPPMQLAMAAPPRFAPMPSAVQQVQSRTKPKPPTPAAPPAPDQPAQAQPQEIPGVASWYTQCPPPGGQGACELLRRVLRPDNQQLMAVVVAPDARAPGQLLATALLPLGINVRESVPFLIDDRFIALLPIETCVPNGCVVSIALSPPMLQAWRQGRQIKFLALTPQGQTIPIALTLDGFGDGASRLLGHS